MTQEEKELLLIQLIMVNGSISSLIEAGLTFVDIHKLIQQYKRAKYIVSDNGKLQITEEGKDSAVPAAHIKIQGGFLTLPANKLSENFRWQ